MLSEKYFTGKPFTEHHQYYFSDDIISSEELAFYVSEIYFKNIANNDNCCFKVENGKPYTSYFIGIDWLSERKEKAIYIQPKLNEGKMQLDYIKMLFSLTNYSEVLNYVNDIYEIKWDDEYIDIEDTQDHLTPLLLVHFLQIMRQIVRKGLKKTYYKVEHNLYGRLKGKVKLASTINRNLCKNKPLNAYCSFEEFGINGLENRLLKKALVFVKRYLNSNKINSEAGVGNLFNYINAAFVDVADEVSLNEVKHFINSGIYKDYDAGIRLAKLILKRFGYNITNTLQKKSIKTPPFWIDMSKLFELYVLALLKDEYKNDIIFQFGNNQETFYGKPDFILKKKGAEIIIDTKYKMQYQANVISFNEYLIKDIRQLSGYARDNRIMYFLKGVAQEIIECLIIYPDVKYLSKKENPKLNLQEKKEIIQFNNFYKLAIRLPILSI